MTVFCNLYGAVYILENSEAQRVKVGMTINAVEGRLEDVNFMWNQKRATCQMCGRRRLVDGNGRIPKHIISGARCSGGDSLPLEKDTSLAELHLRELRLQAEVLKGTEKASAVRKFNSLEKRIALYRAMSEPVGEWECSTVFYTKSAESVELLAHKFLEEKLDTSAPFGEVFSCSVLEATDAVEAALSQYGLLASAKKKSGTFRKL